ncbi:hypothetical protein BJ684DRAFT_15277 [Piptocephalis cylindrospora]|uniref:S-adenosyl-L-methionine-dependent methyltransferase n=1 Tax=Piptocephalis cylindrospora TaxID=1907219 RepID=A0A4P9Y7X6_9FUNG|nr:hypothetical protein BJ684DRAFT_15277 [Piptocephalis cylindrospora]|eukprot:RKP14391.1 hypothetical protein BJ684DRAFT_15277 [Piptocephalis cylindrospora]
MTPRATPHPIIHFTEPMQEQVIAGHLDNLGFLPVIRLLKEALQDLPRQTDPNSPYHILDVTRGAGVTEPLDTILQAMHETRPSSRIQLHRRPSSLPISPTILTSLGDLLLPDIICQDGGLFHPYCGDRQGSADMAVSVMHLQFLSKVPPPLPSSESQTTEDLVWGMLRSGEASRRAKEDMTHFFQARAKELRRGGQLVFALVLRDPLSDLTGARLMDRYMRTLEDMHREDLLSSTEVSSLVLPVYLRSDDEINHSLAAAKGDFYVAEYAEHRACMTAWPIFDDGRISSQVYGQACAAVVRGLVQRWGRLRLGAERWSAVEGVLEQKVAARVAADPTPGWVRFAYIRMERM